LAQILHDGEIDEKALEEIEKRGNAAVSASAYFLAARHEYEAKRYDPARQYIQRALELAPDASGLHAWYAMLLLDRGESFEAIVQGERAVQLDPASAGAQSVLGQAYYRAERLDDAVAAWERAQELGPNEEVAKLLAKAKREAAVEGRFLDASTSHFVVRFEGGKPAEALANELSDTLERQYYAVGRDLGIRLDTAITVVLYSQEQFSEATEAPSWAGALNDGKMRVPLGDVTRVTPQVEAVLRHELTHSFVHAATTRCPVWLNEGLAQMEEPRSLRNLPAPVQKQVCSGKPRAVPQLSRLEGSFAEFAPNQARVAYAKALAAAEYIRDTYGMDALLRLLSALAAGKDTGKAVEETTGDDYAHLDQQAAQYLVKQACP
jgi:tetratricopeptide (TPR) repeat protein